MVEPTRLTDSQLEGLLEIWHHDAQAQQLTRALVEEVRRLRARNEQLEDALMAMSLTTDIQWKEPR